MKQRAELQIQIGDELLEDIFNRPREILSYLKRKVAEFEEERPTMQLVEIAFCPLPPFNSTLKFRFEDRSSVPSFHNIVKFGK